MLTVASYPIGGTVIGSAIGLTFGAAIKLLARENEAKEADYYAKMVTVGFAVAGLAYSVFILFELTFGAAPAGIIAGVLLSGAILWLRDVKDIETLALGLAFGAVVGLGLGVLGDLANGTIFIPGARSLLLTI